MITLEQMQAEADKHARQARRQAREPFQVWWEGVQDVGRFRRMCAKVPFLGDYVHPDWQAFDANIKGLWTGRVGMSPAPFTTYSYAWFFVDSSGFGTEGEGALTIAQFQAAMRFLLLAHDATFGLGIREAGQFQVYIGLYVRKDATWDGSRFRVAGLHDVSQPYGTAYKAAHPERKDINP